MGNPPNKGRVTVVEEEKQSRTNSQSGRRPGLGLRFVQAAEEWFTCPLTCLKLKSHVIGQATCVGGVTPMTGGAQCLPWGQRDRREPRKRRGGAAATPQAGIPTS